MANYLTRCHQCAQQFLTEKEYIDHIQIFQPSQEFLEHVRLLQSQYFRAVTELQNVLAHRQRPDQLDFEAYEDALPSVASKGQFACPEKRCGIRTKRKQELLRHFATHVKGANDAWKCASCNDTFAGASKFMWHACWKTKSSEFISQRERVSTYVENELNRKRNIQRQQHRRSHQDGTANDTLRPSSWQTGLPSVGASSTMEQATVQAIDELGDSSLQTGSQLFFAQPFNSIHTASQHSGMWHGGDFSRAQTELPLLGNPSFRFTTAQPF